MSNRSLRSPFLALLCASLLPSVLVAQSDLLQTDITAGPAGNPNYNNDKVSSTDASLTDQYSYSASGTAESSQANVAYGSVTVTANASASAPPGNSLGSGSITLGKWQNEVVITSPGRENTSATIRQTLHTSGGVSAQGSSPAGGGYVEYEVNAGRSDGTGGDYFGGYSSGGGQTGTPLGDRATFTVDNSFMFGTPVQLFGYVRINCGASTALSSDAESGSSAAAITLSDGGFVVLDDQGNLLDFTAQSRTGSAKAVSYPASGDYVGFSLTNQMQGSVGTTAQLLGGTASAPTQVAAFYVPPPPGNLDVKPLSDVLELTGTGNDPVVVKVTFDPAILQGLGRLYYLQLGWAQGSSGVWKNATLGNTGTTEPTFFDRGYNPATDFHLGYYGIDRQTGYVWAVVNHGGQFAVVPHPAFFTGEVALSNNVYYLAFPNGTPFGYYAYLGDPSYIYHFDLGYEYIFEANDGRGGVYLYDFKSGHFFYTSPTYPFPYLYDFSLNSVLYYYPDPKNPGRYNTDGVRYFYNYATGQIISQ